MWTVFLVALAIGAPTKPEPATKEKEDPPAKLELFGGEDWYKGQPGKEEEFVGLLEGSRRAGGKAPGFGRFNPYRLVMGGEGKKSVREVYNGGKPELLAPYVGQKVKLVGKAVDMEVEGTDHHEIWPARLEQLAAEDKTGADPHSK